MTWRFTRRHLVVRLVAIVVLYAVVSGFLLVFYAFNDDQFDNKDDDNLVSDHLRGSLINNHADGGYNIGLVDRRAEAYTTRPIGELVRRACESWSAIGCIFVI